MTWKFWTLGARRAEEKLRLAEYSEKALLDRLCDRALEIERLKRVLRFKHRPSEDDPAEPQILSALAVVNDTTPLWRAVHRLLDLLEADQKSAVCLASLNNEQRHYNAGRLAMCEDLRVALLQKWAEAQRENQEAQRPDF